MNIKVNGCSNCPFSYEYDMSSGYGCSVLRGRPIKESEKFQPITPDWCPLKESNIIIEIE